MNINTLITVSLPSDVLVATGGMMMELGDPIIAQEISQQILHQLVQQDADIDGIVAGNVIDPVQFSLPLGIVMVISSVLAQNLEGEHATSIAHLIRGWLPALNQVRDLLDGKPNEMPFDEFGNCMN